jgi:hypothetical protein
VGGRELRIVDVAVTSPIVCAADWYAEAPLPDEDESIDGVISIFACDILCWNDGSAASTVPPFSTSFPFPPLFSPLAVVVDTSGLITLYASLEKNRTLWPVPGVLRSRKIERTLPEPFPSAMERRCVSRSIGV